MSSTVNLYDSSLPDIYETPNSTTYNTTTIYSGMYDHSYSFVSDVDKAVTGARESAAYYLQRMPAAMGAGDNTGASLSNLQVSDRLYYDVSNGRDMWLDGFDSGGLVFSASDNVQATLNVQYYTDSGYSSPSAVQYQYRNGASGSTGLFFTNTPVNPVTGTADEKIAMATLPAMSSLDLSSLNLKFTNGDAKTLHINKVWITFTVVVPTYTSINLAGNTQFTAVNTYIGVDFSDKENHNTLVLRDNSMAYLYGVTIDTSVANTVSPAARQPAFVSIDRTVEATVSSKSSSDTTGQSVGSLTAVDGSLYTIGTNKIMELNGFNTSDLNGPLSGAVLTLTYSTDPSYGQSDYLQWRAEDGTFHNTAIMPQQSIISVSASFNLYDNGMAVLKFGGKQAITHVRVLERFPSHSYIECRLETGRTHQIRVHMREAQHPLAGDPVYGNLRHKMPEDVALAVKALARQALHAYKLSLTHPATGELMTWSARVPDDMRHLLATLRRPTETSLADDEDWDDDQYDVEVHYVRE